MAFLTGSLFTGNLNKIEHVLGNIVKTLSSPPGTYQIHIYLFLYKTVGAYK